MGMLGRKSTSKQKSFKKITLPIIQSLQLVQLK
jgi:hypothetical protein